MTIEKLQELRAIATAATPGPWRWELNLKARNLNLCGGRPTFDRTVMDFERWGMGSAVPRFDSHLVPYGLMTKAHEFAKVVPGREHHADWFQTVDHPDAHHIAAACPSVVLDLLDTIDRLQFERDELEKALRQSSIANTI